MNSNLHSTEKLVRVLIGLVLVIIGYLFMLPMHFSIVFYIVGAYLVLSGLFGWCVLYNMFGHSNKRRVTRITKQDIEEAVKQYPVNSANDDLNSVKIDAVATKKVVTKKPVAKKAPAKKAAAPKTKTVVKKAAAKKATPVAKKKPAVKKTVTKKPVANKSTVKKAPAKKPATKKSTKK